MYYTLLVSKMAIFDKERYPNLIVINFNYYPLFFYFRLLLKFFIWVGGPSFDFARLLAKRSNKKKFIIFAISWRFHIA